MFLNPKHTIDGSITVHSRGGLGNQLFIFGAGLALADQLGCRLYIDPSQHKYTKKLPFVIDNLISNFSISLQELVSLTPIPNVGLQRRLLSRSIPRCCSYNEPSYQFDPMFFELHENACVWGYFQSWKYLDLLKTSRVGDIQSAVKQLGKSSTKFESTDIVLHLRRGDYLNRGTIEIHGILGFEYYVRSINHLRQLGYSGSIWVISESRIDDIHSLEDLIGIRVNQIFGLSIWQDLSLLIEAPALVIANSTFSWMGGWLGTLDRPVIAPNPWFKTQEYDTSDLIPANWKKISHDF